MGCTVSVMTPHHIAEALMLWQSTDGIGLDNRCDSWRGLEAYLDGHRGYSRVALDSGGRLVGAALCGTDGRRGYLHHVAVSREHRGEGLGRALVESCLNRLASAGVDKCSVFVFAANATGRRFWERLGWIERPDLVIMQKSTLREVCTT